jgi:hypothetical protein
LLSGLGAHHRVPQGPFGFLQATPLLNSLSVIKFHRGQLVLRTLELMRQLSQLAFQLGQGGHHAFVVLPDARFLVDQLLPLRLSPFSGRLDLRHLALTGG